MVSNKIVAIAVSLSLLLTLIFGESGAQCASSFDSAVDQGPGLNPGGTQIKTRILAEAGHDPLLLSFNP